MLIKDIMTKGVITAPSSMLVNDAKKMMRERNFRRLPVVDDGKVVGIVTESNLEKVSPKIAAPLVWQISYLVSHTTLRDVMKKKVVTISPEATVEQGVDLAQRNRVGSLVVVKKGAVVGIVTTNDFFYKIINPILGLGVSGARIIVYGCGEGRCAEKIIASINKLGVGIKLIWTLQVPSSDRKDIILHLDIEDPSVVIEELGKLGFSAKMRAR